MSYLITRPSETIVAIDFSGEVGINERFLAVDEAGKEARRHGTAGSFLIDLSAADLLPYGISHALAMADSVRRKRRPFSKVAYVTRPDQKDAVAAVLAHLHSPSSFGRFTNKEAAITWLQDARSASSPGKGSRHNPE